MSDPRTASGTTSRFALLVCGGVVAFSGASVLVAWALQAHAAIQIHTQFDPLHYNSALALVLAGAGLAAMACKRWCIGLGAGILLIAAAMGKALCQAAGGNAWATEWLFPADPLLPPFPACGFGWNQAVAMLLFGLSLVLMSRRAPGLWQCLALAGAGSVLLLLAVTAIIDSPVALGSPHKKGAPIVFTLGALAAAIAILAHAVTEVSGRVAVARALPISIWLGGASCTVIMWYALDAQQTQRVRHDVQFDGSHAHLQLERSLDERLGPVAIQAEKLRGRGGDLQAFKDDAGNFIGSQPGALGVGFVAGDSRISWVESRQGVTLPTSLDRTGGGGPLASAVSAARPMMARAQRSYWNGMWMLLAYFPVQENDPAKGGLLLVLQARPFLDSILNINVAPGYALEIHEGDEVIYERFASETRYRDQYRMTRRVAGRGLDWKLDVWPTETVLDRKGFSVAKLALFVGLVLVTLCALSVHLAQMSRRRAVALEREVRERTQAEAALRQSEAKCRSLIDNLEQGVFLKDNQGRYQAANAAYCRWLGRAEADVLGRTDSELFPGNVAQDRANEVATILAYGKRIETEDKEAVAGEQRTIRRMLSPVRDEDGKPVAVLGVVWDVTDQRAMEARLRQAGKMDAIGQLAGGIAHDFNNLLTAILGNLELMLLTLPEGDRNRELVQAAQGAATRATSLTSRLLGFARQHQLDRQPTSLNAIVEEVVALLRRTIDPRIRIETERDADLWAVLADPAQMNQVLMNLCLNARDAIRDGGRICISTANVEFAEHDGARHPDGRAGRFVRLSVRDDGAGMPAEVRARIFEPFFTTKEIGKGTGLGLAMVFGIVRQHKGWVECQSELGVGTCFDIYLPRTDVAGPQMVSSRPEAPVATGQETILVADDEPVVRRLTATVLRKQGYKALEAEDGQQAVDLYSREHARIDLAVLDLTMPVLSGQDAFRQMLQINPQARVMFASGYAAEQVGELEAERILGFVKKPFRPQELVKQIQDALKRCRPELPTRV
jgi:PAS domain S-box-containing protein